MFTSSKRWSLPAHPHRKAGVRPLLVLAIGALLAGSALAQPALSLTTDEGPVGRYRPQHTDAEREKIRKNLVNGVTIPYWTQPITSPINGVTYPMTMVGSSSPFDEKPKNSPIQYQLIALKIKVKTDTGIVVQNPMTPPCGEKVPAIDLMMQSPLFREVPFKVNGVDVTKRIGGAAQFSSIFQRANFWGQLTKTDPQGNHWQVHLKSSVKKPIIEEIELDGTSREYTCVGGKGTSARVKMAEFEPKVWEIAKKHAAPNQIIFIMPYNVVMLSKNERFIVYGWHDAIPIGNDVQTFAVSSYFDTVSYTANFHLNDIDSMVHEYVELLNDPFAEGTEKPFPSMNEVPKWRTPSGSCQRNLEPGDAISWYNATPYEITGANGYRYHFRDSAFYQWFFRLPTTAAGGKYSMMGTLTNYQENICQ